tara:strand:- start:84 stop:437 length:354 start_codon:yes stop_codon:yes gene_type:complete
MLRRQALAEDAKPRKWAVKGMRTPKDRRLEREFQEALKRQRTSAEEMKRLSERYDEEVRDALLQVVLGTVLHRARLLLFCSSASAAQIYTQAHCSFLKKLTRVPVPSRMMKRTNLFV